MATTPKSAPAQILRARDAALYLDVSEAYLRKARREGDGPTFSRYRRTIRYRLEDLNRWLTKHRVDALESGR
jgi:hypothetical protein